jgi:hypothetical protein
MMIEQHDTGQIHCRMLGHEVPFTYCRQGSNKLPCRKIFDCWFEIFPVEEFIRDHYSEEQIRQFLTPPPPKLASILDLIQKAQSQKDNSSSQ